MKATIVVAGLMFGSVAIASCGLLVTPLMIAGSGSLGTNPDCHISSPNTSESQRSQYVMQFFASNGYTPEQAAGIVGNMTAESHVDPKVWEGDEQDHDYPPEPDAPRKGWGLVQWTPASKIVNYAASVGKPPYEMDTQLEFLWKQLEGISPENQERRAGDALKGVKGTGPKGVAEATTIFLQYYERARPSTAHAQARVNAALAAFNNYDSRSSTCTPGIASQPVSPGVEKAIKVAEQYLGTPYYFGGRTPETGFDCSGLVHWAFDHAGWNIPDATAAGEYNWGAHVSYKQLQRGDLVFWATDVNDPTTIDHVAIFLGYDKSGVGWQIAAPYTGQVVRERPMWRSEKLNKTETLTFIGGVRMPPPNG